MEDSLARLLVDYCLEVQPGQSLAIEAKTPALPLLEALHREVLQRGGYPLLLVEYPEQQADFLRWGQTWLQQIPAVRSAIYQNIDATLRIQSDDNPLSLAEIDPSILAQQQKAWRDLARLRLQKRWCLTLYPTTGYAQQAGLSNSAYRELVKRALFLDRPDPVAAWRELSVFQAQLIAHLQPVQELHLLAPGTDLKLAVGGRTWVNSDGKRNMPSGEVFTGPIENSANGYVRFNLPAVVSGQRVAGVFLRFKDGQVIEASAEQGQSYLEAMLASDAGARFLGEIGIGSNYGISQPTGNILFDEKMGGSVHLALGQSYAETGGRNNSAIHWDLVLDLREGGQILADGKALQQNGMFVL